MIRLVTLDAMGTLVRLDQPVRRLAAALRARGVEVSEDEARHAILAEFAYYKAHHDDATDPDRLLDLRRRCAEVMTRALPPAARGLDADERLEALLESLRFVAYDEVPGTLRGLRERGLALIVVSNWDVSLHEALRRTGLRDLVDEVLTSAECGVGKPDAAIFELALRRAGVRPAEALHVGDSPDVDVEGPLAAGLAAALLQREGPAPSVPVPVLRSLAGITGLLA